MTVRTAHGHAYRPPSPSNIRSLENLMTRASHLSPLPPPTTHTTHGHAEQNTACCLTCAAAASPSIYSAGERRGGEGGRPRVPSSFRCATPGYTARRVLLLLLQQPVSYEPGVCAARLSSACLPLRWMPQPPSPQLVVSQPSTGGTSRSKTRLILEVFTRSHTFE